MKSFKYITILLTLLSSCDIGGYLLVKPSNRNFEIQTYDGCEVKFMLSTFRNDSYVLCAEVSASDEVTIFPDSLQIKHNTNEIKYITSYKKQKGKISKLEISSGKSYVYFGFNIEPGTVKKGDIFYISANNFFCDSNTCYNIEPIEFVNHEIFY